MMSTSFGVPPVYFDTTIEVDDEQERWKLEEKIDDTVWKYMAGGRSMRSRTFLIFCFCFASICYYFQFLFKNLHARDRSRPSFLYFYP